MQQHPTNLAVLKHVALFRLTIQECVQRIFFPKGSGGEAGNVLRNLTAGDQPSLRLHSRQHGFAQNVSYYTLTKKGAKEAGVTPNRAAEQRGPEAVRTHLATLWFSCMGAKRYYRLEPRELTSLFGKGVVHANTAHCITQDKDGPRVYRVYPASSGSEATVAHLDEVLTGIGEVPEKKAVYEWLKDRDYGFAVLGPTPEACDDLSRAINRRDAGLTDRAHIIVRLGPSPETIRQAIYNYRDGQP